MWITRESPHRACSKFPQNRGQNRVNITALPTLHTTRIYRKHLNTVWMTMHESNQPSNNHNKKNLLILDWKSISAGIR